jgi:hypothetical protein
MHSDLVPLLKVKKSLLFSWTHKCVSHNDYAHVFHTVDAKFRDEDHVVFFEGKLALEVVLEEIYS